MLSNDIYLYNDFIATREYYCYGPLDASIGHFGLNCSYNLRLLGGTDGAIDT